VSEGTIAQEPLRRFGRRASSAPTVLEKTRWAPYAVGAATGVWFVVMLTMALVRHAGYLTGRFDHGNMVQAIWNTAHGRPLELTFQDGEQTIRLAAHADVFLVLLAPFSLVFPTPELLVVVQTAALAAGAVPVFWIARKHMSSDIGAVAMTLAYLLYPWIAWLAVGDFHSVTVGIAFLLFAIWALEEDRLGLFALFAGLALTTHELVGLNIALLGAWYALARGRRRAGAVIAVAGAAWSALMIGVVIPAFADGTNLFYGRLESVGGSPSGIVRTLFEDPGRVLGAVATGDDYIYLFLVLAPLGMLWIYSPSILLVAAPQLSVNLLSDWYASTSPTFHYTAAIVPFVIVASIHGAARFSRGRARGGIIAVVCAALFFVAFAPRPGPFLDVLQSRPHEAIHDALALVPGDARVSATEGLGGRLSERRVIYSFPTIADAEWVVVDRHNAWLPDLPSVRRGWQPAQFERAVERFESDRRFRVVFDRDDIAVFVRRATAPNDSAG
jgi:uncharacterized membrane protein